MTKRSYLPKFLLLSLTLLFILPLCPLGQPSTEQRESSAKPSRARRAKASFRSRAPYERLAQALADAAGTTTSDAPTPLAILPVLNYADLPDKLVTRVETSLQEAVHANAAISSLPLGPETASNPKDVVLRSLAYRDVPYLVVPILERNHRKVKLIVLLRPVSSPNVKAAFQEYLQVPSDSEDATFTHHSHLLVNRPVYDFTIQNSTLSLLSQNAVLRYDMNGREMSLIEEIVLPSNNVSKTASRWPMGRIVVTPRGEMYVHASWMKKGVVITGQRKNRRIYPTLSNDPISASEQRIAYAEPIHGTPLLQSRIQQFPLSFHDLKHYAWPALGIKFSLFTHADGHLGMALENAKQIIYSSNRYGADGIFLDGRVVVTSSSEPIAKDHLIVLRVDLPEKDFQEIETSHPFWGALTVLKHYDLDGDGDDEILLLEQFGEANRSFALIHILEAHLPL